MDTKILLLDKKFVESYAAKSPKWGFNGLGFLVYKRTYARIKADGTNEDWHETVERCINGAQKIGAKYTKAEMERLFDHIFYLRCNFAGRMLWQLGTPTVDRFGANSLLNCLAGETKVLTRQGWKEIKNLENKTVEIFTSYGKSVEAPFRCFGEQVLTKITFANANGSKTWDIFATPEHRWLLLDKKNTGRKESLTLGLKIGDKVPVVRPKNSSQYLSPQGIQHGLILGDGSCNGYESFVDLIDDTYTHCKDYFILNRISWTNPENARHVRYGGFPNSWKQLPDINENKPYLMGFLAGWLAADGSVNKSNGQIRLFSSIKTNLLVAKDIAAVCGFRTSDTYLERDSNPFNEEPSELWSISFNLNDNPEILIIRNDQKVKLKESSEVYENFARVLSLEETDRKEKVYCCTVPETECFVIDGNILTGNCWVTAISKPEDFCFLFENLMLGGGVGFSVRREDVHEFPKIKVGVKITHEATKDADFIIPDSRGGWVSILRKVLNSYFYTGDSFSYSTVLVRGAGELIHGFGGTASGPRILVEGLEKICKILASREGKKIRSIDALDICNIIGSIVVAGNVRRSAEIALGDPDDILFLRAKRWDLGNIPNWRAMSNNTIYADDFEHIMEEVWQGYKGNGEPYGFFNLPLSQKYGRTKDGKLGKDHAYLHRSDNCIGINPCGEIPLADKECCNLSELYLNNLSSVKELIDCAKLLYKTQKAISALSFIHNETNEVVHKNMRLGMGVTGICQSLDKIKWLSECYETLREFDKEWSKINHWPESIKLTTCKPSGTLSLLGGSTPGVHPGFSKYYIRRVRMSSGDKLVPYCKELGYHVEFAMNYDKSLDHTTVVVEFPCFSGDNAILTKDMTAVKQLEIVKQLQSEWSDNAVSVTVYYKPEELEDIKKWMRDNYEGNIKSVSFLLHSEHGFLQAPYQEITEDQYKELISKIKPIKSLIIDMGMESLDTDECKGGVCPIK